MKSRPEWRAHLFSFGSSSPSSFVTIHAQWANPPWLTRLTRFTRRPFPKRTKSAFRPLALPPADTVNQAANDDGDRDDDSLLLNLTPLNCRRTGECPPVRPPVRPSSGDEDEIPPRTRIAVRSISVDGMGRSGRWPPRSPSRTHTKREESRLFFAFPDVVVLPKLDVQVLAPSS